MAILLAFGAAGFAQQSQGQPGGGKLAPETEPLNWAGLVFEWLVSDPNPVDGTVGAEAVCILNRDTGWKYPTDLGNHVLQLATGPSYRIPQGVSLRGGERLVIAFGDGVKFDQQLLAEYDVLSLRAQGFANDFFQNGGNGGGSDLLALLAPNGQTVMEAIVFSEGMPSLYGPLADMVYRQREWERGTYVPQGQLSLAEGDIYYTRMFPFALDSNTWYDWGPPLQRPAPIPGTDHFWYVYQQGQGYVRTWEESAVRGRVVVSVDSETVTPVPGAAVTLLGLGLYATTDADGLFTIFGAPKGSLPILATAQGHSPQFQVVEDKSANGASWVSFILQPKNPGTTVNVSLSAGGGIIFGPDVITPAGSMPSFVVELYPNPNLPSSVTATWLPGGFDSVSIDSVTRQRIRVMDNGQQLEIDAYRGWEHVGGIEIEPHIAAPPGGGPAGRVWILYQDPFPGAGEGNYVLMEGIDGQGRLEYLSGGEEAFPDGLLVKSGQSLYAQAEVPHFSQIHGWKETLMEGNKAIWYRYGRKTPDKNGDGVVDPDDSNLFYCQGGLCPGSDATLTLEWSETISTTQASGSKSGGKGGASFEGETGAILKLFVKGKIKVGGSGFREWSREDSQTNSYTVGGKVEVRMNYDIDPGDPPRIPSDMLEKCAVIHWQLVDINFGMCTYPYPSDIHVCSDPEHDPAPDTILAVPIGIYYTRDVDPEVHCP